MKGGGRVEGGREVGRREESESKGDGRVKGKRVRRGGVIYGRREAWGEEREGEGREGERDMI